MDKKNDAIDILYLWQKTTDALGGDRHQACNLGECLDDLSTLLKTHSIEYFEAKTLKKKVINYMVSEKGKTDRGQYKGWMANVGEAYFRSLALYYSDEFERDDTIVDKLKLVNGKKVTKIDTYGGEDYMDRNLLIVAWSKDKFKDRWTESICLECHRTFGPLLDTFEKEVMHSKWASSGAEVPKWAGVFFV